MKICFVVPRAYLYFNSSIPNVPTPGGAERQVYLIGTHLAEDIEHDVHFCVADFGQPKIEHYSKVSVWKSFSLHENPLIGLWKLYRCLNSINADIYIFRSASIGTALGILITKFLVRRKVFYMVAHDYEVNSHLLTKMFNSTTASLMKYVYPLANIITTQSEYQKEKLEYYRNISITAIIRNVYIIQPDINLQYQVDRNHILWVGRSVVWKRPEFFLKLAHYFPHLQFVMIAPKTSEDLYYYKKIRNQAKQITNLQLFDFVKPDKIKCYYKNALIYVITSEAEGFANTMMEAMEAGCPIVSLNVNPDGILEKYKMGFCAYNDEELFLKYFRQLVDDKSLREEMGQNARQYLIEYHDINTINNQVKSILKRCNSTN